MRLMLSILIWPSLVIGFFLMFQVFGHLSTFGLSSTLFEDEPRDHRTFDGLDRFSRILASMAFLQQGNPSMTSHVYV